MKKFFSFVAAALVAFSFASCKGGQNEPEQPAKQTLKITVTDITPNGATVEIMPTLDTVPYFWAIVNGTLLKQYTADSLAVLLIEEEVAYGATYESFEKDSFILTGKFSYTFSSMQPETEYAVLAFPIDKELKVTGSVESKTFTTKQLVITKTETIRYEDAILIDYTAYGMFQLMVQDRTNGIHIALTFNSESLEGVFTETDINQDYSGLGNKDGVYSIKTLTAKSELIESGAKLQLSGTMDVTNGVRYNFTIIAPVAAEAEPAALPVRYTHRNYFSSTQSRTRTIGLP